MDEDMAEEREAMRDLVALTEEMGLYASRACPECGAEVPPGPGRAYDECPACHWVEGY